MSNPAAVAQPVQDFGGNASSGWMSMHDKFVQELREKQPVIVFMGASQIAYMAQTAIWMQKIKPLHCVNFGIPGDRTENVLWRVQNGEMDHAKPKVIVLLVGTNNYDKTSDQVAEGILAIVKLIQENQPSSHVIILGLLPRGETPNTYRDKDVATNQRLAGELQNNPKTTFLNVGEEKFMNEEGIISPSVMHDFLHLTPDIGYQIVCEPLLKEIHNVLSSPAKEESS